MKTRPVRVFIADDHHIVVMGLAALLSLEDRVEVVGTATTASDAIKGYQTHQPDLLLIDLRMPDVDGIQATEIIRAEFAHARILMLTSFNADDEIYRALKAGVSGYLLKEAGREELMQAILTIHEGGRWIPREIARLAKERARQPQLSMRELEVLELVIKGLSNKEIAQVLQFSEDGAKQHLRRIYAKLGVEGRAEAASEAIRRGILRAD